MCKIISSDAIIGNFILELVEKNNFCISIDKMIHWDEKLSENLKKHNYYTKFDFHSILDFQDNYPFFIESVESNCIKIFNKLNKITLMNQLARYFRIGMPKLVVDEIISTLKNI